MRLESSLDLKCEIRRLVRVDLETQISLLGLALVSSLSSLLFATLVF